MNVILSKHKHLLLSILTGTLLAISWPARGLPLLAFIALLPLLWVEDSFHAQRDKPGLVRMFVHAWLAFFVFNILTTWWIMFASIPGMLVAVLLNPVFMAIPWTLMHTARRILPGRQGQMSLILFWLSFEFLHAGWDLSWSWLDLGNVFAAWPALVQWYEYTGTAGGTLWILAANLLAFSLVQAFSHATPQKRRIANMALLVSILVVPVVVSLQIWFSYTEKADPVEVVVVQPSNNPYDRVERILDAEARIWQLVTLAEPHITPATRFIVAPEGANPRGIWMHEAEDHFAVRQLRDHVSNNPQLSWVLGSFTYRMYEAGEPHPSSAEPMLNGNRHYDAYNSAIMIAHGKPVAYYHKSKLVPGIEQMPFHRFLKPLGRLVTKFGGTQGSLGTQDHRSVFSSDDDEIRVAPLVCYESIYGAYMGEYFRLGAGLTFIITNDGWWRNTPGHRQHFQYARLRAIESRRSVARAASTGISGFIDQTGRIIQQSNWWETTALSASIHQNYTLTFFSRTGNFLGKLSLFLSVLLLLFMLSQRIISR